MGETKSETNTASEETRATRVVVMEDGLFGVKSDGSEEVIRIDIRQQWKFHRVIGWAITPEHPWIAVCLPATDDQLRETKTGDDIIMFLVDCEKMVELDAWNQKIHDEHLNTEPLDTVCVCMKCEYAASGRDKGPEPLESTLAPTLAPPVID